MHGFLVPDQTALFCETSVAPGTSESFDFPMNRVQMHVQTTSVSEVFAANVTLEFFYTLVDSPHVKF